MNKYIKSVLATIGVASSALGLFQFYNVSTYPVLTGEFCLGDSTEKGRLIEIVHKVAKNSGGIIYFDQVYIQDSPCYPSAGNLEFEGLRFEDGSYDNYNLGEKSAVQVYTPSNQPYFDYSFNFSSFINDNELNTYNEEELRELSKILLEKHNINYEKSDLDIFDGMWIMSMSGFNARVTFNTDNMSQNQYTAINGVREGEAILIDGPFQIKNTSGGEHVGYDLSAPVIDSSEKKQIECTKKDWGSFRKSLFCPFI